jgi:hypothetical protein
LAERSIKSSPFGRRAVAAWPFPFAPDPDTMDWLMAAGMVLALIAPAPFFWCPPAWVFYFLSQRTRDIGRAAPLQPEQRSSDTATPGASNLASPDTNEPRVGIA